MGPASPAAPAPCRPPAFWVSALSVAPTCVRIARNFARDVLAASPAADLDTVRVVVSELVTNAQSAAVRLATVTGHPWQYDDHPVQLRICTDGPLCTLVAVRDPDPHEPVRCTPDVTDEHGRGIQIVESLTADLWVAHNRYFKTVYAVVPYPGLGAAQLATVHAFAAAHHTASTAVRP